MPFSIGTGLKCVGIVGPELKLSLGQCASSGRWTPLQQTRNKEDRRGLARCLSDAQVNSSLIKEKINCLEEECSACLSPMGWPGIYSICFSQLDGDKDSFPLDGGTFCLYHYRINKG